MNSIRYVVSGFLVYTTGDFPTGTINVYGDTTIQIATTFLPVGQQLDFRLVEPEKPYPEFWGMAFLYLFKLPR